MNETKFLDYQPALHKIEPCELVAFYRMFSDNLSVKHKIIIFVRCLEMCYHAYGHYRETDHCNQHKTCDWENWADGPWKSFKAVKKHKNYCTPHCVDSFNEHILLIKMVLFINRKKPINLDMELFHQTVVAFFHDGLGFLLTRKDYKNHRFCCVERSSSSRSWGQVLNFGNRYRNGTFKVSHASEMFSHYFKCARYNNNSMNDDTKSMVVDILSLLRETSPDLVETSRQQAQSVREMLPENYYHLFFNRFNIKEPGSRIYYIKNYDNVKKGVYSDNCNVRKTMYKF